MRHLSVYRDGDTLSVAELVARWVACTPHLSPVTLYHHGMAVGIEALTPEAAARWVTAATANNSVRNRLSIARGFSRWLIRQGVIDQPLTDEWDADVRKARPKVYGKKQAMYPARFLNMDELRRLFGACKDGTWVGSRDQLAMRLGAMGLRNAELRSATWGNYHPDGLIRLTGKKHRIREIAPGPILADLLARWRRQYEQALGRPIRPEDPILCGMTYRRFTTGRTHAEPAVAWGTPIHPDSLRSMVVRRAEQAGLGHVTPHDLRRSTASILHNAKSADGGHLYDLLDIQKVLDHADPATTQRSYIDQLDTATKIRAGVTLDL